MTYSFSPTPDMSDVHTGFYFTAAFCIFMLVSLTLTHERGATVQWRIIVATLTIAFTWFVDSQSYRPDHPSNTQVIADFVGIQAEGFKEQSGKYKVDRHYLYVVYKAEDKNIILRAAEGREYPQRAVLYKN